MPTKKNETKSGQTKVSHEFDIEVNKKTAMLSYVWILCLIPLLTKTKSEFAQFHAKQGFVLFVLSLFTIVPFFGQLFSLVLIIISAIGVYKVWNGEYWEIPIINRYSEKIKI